MSIKTQLIKLKENWVLTLLLIIIVIIVLAALNSRNLYSPSFRLAMDSGSQFSSGKETLIERAIPSPDSDDQNFAPQIKERKIVKIAELFTEVKRGEFPAAESRLKNIVASSDSYLINERVDKNGTGVKQYYNGQYEIKVEVGKYDSVVSQLKEIGEVEKFNENTADVTASYANLEIELETEKSRLARYQEMYNETTDIKDKITLNDRIFEQERTVKYYEDRLATMDSKIDYSTVNITISEKKSKFYHAKFVEFSALAETIVGSINVLLKIIFAVFPYLVLAGLIYLIVRAIRSKKRK